MKSIRIGDDRFFFKDIVSYSYDRRARTLKIFLSGFGSGITVADMCASDFERFDKAAAANV